MQKNSKPVAHIIIGFIGSGKTTFARKLEKETGAIRFTKDEWMVRVFGNTPPKDRFNEYDNKMTTLATDMALECLKAGISVIIDEGFWVKEHRDAIKEKVKNSALQQSLLLNFMKDFFFEKPLGFAYAPSR